MSKLFKLKKWLLLKDAANYLSVAMSEPVQEADILQLALDGHITISIDIVQPIYGKRANVVSRANVRRLPGIPVKGQPAYEVTLGVRLDEDRFLDFHNAPVQSLEGVFDLPMIGGEGILVTKAFQKITRGVNVDLMNIEGVFLQEPPTVEFGAGDYFQVFDYLDRKLNWSDLEWYPLGNLPDGVVLVVRTAALNDFLKNTEVDAVPEMLRPVETKERNTLLCIIAALCTEAKIPYDKPAKAAGYIQSTAAKMGVSIGETTIEGHLKKIIYALPTRMK